MDVYDRLVEGDLKQAAAVIATFAYHAAMRPEPLPRKALPKPTPPRPTEGSNANATTNTTGN